MRLCEILEVETSTTLLRVETALQDSKMWGNCNSPANTKTNGISLQPVDTQHLVTIE